MVLSPERALEKLRRIQHQSITINTEPVTGLTTITQEHANILAALSLKKPTLNRAPTAQLSLL